MPLELPMIASAREYHKRFGLATFSRAQPRRSLIIVPSIMKTLFDLIQSAPPDKTAIVLPESSVQVSYGAFRRQILALAEALTAAGVNRRDGVGIALHGVRPEQRLQLRRISRARAATRKASGSNESTLAGLSRRVSSQAAGLGRWPIRHRHRRARGHLPYRRQQDQLWRAGRHRIRAAARHRRAVDSRPDSGVQ
jgi:hypothetical protein